MTSIDRGRLVAVVLAVAAVVVVSAKQDPAGPDPVATFLQRTDPPPTSYRARRHLEARNQRFNKSAWLDAMTELGPGGLTVTVLDKGGSDYILTKVLLPALQAEQDMRRSPAASAVTTDNYQFAADGFEDNLARIRLAPLRKDKVLLDGWLLVSPADADLVIIKGRLAKNPSFWTTRVDVSRRYQRIAGLRVPVEMQSTASVRIAGTSTFLMTYTYETINGMSVASSAAFTGLPACGNGCRTP